VRTSATDERRENFQSTQFRWNDNLEAIIARWEFRLVPHGAGRGSPGFRCWRFPTRRDRGFSPRISSGMEEFETHLPMFTITNDSQRDIMTSLAITGAAGRMGMRLSPWLNNQAIHRFLGATSGPIHDASGARTGEIAGIGPIGCRSRLICAPRRR